MNWGTREMSHLWGVLDLKSDPIDVSSFQVFLNPKLSKSPVYGMKQK